MVVLEEQNYQDNIKKYNSLVERLKEVLGNNTIIHHVGSTAIPNMIGKNIIDILIGINSEEEMDLFTNKLKEIGFYPGKNSTGYTYRFFASKEEETTSGDIHIHLADTNSDRYKDFIILKEYLLENTEERENYANFKKKIITNGNNIREDYKSIKSKYVTDLLQRARKNIKK